MATDNEVGAVAGATMIPEVAGDAEYEVAGRSNPAYEDAASACSEPGLAARPRKTNVPEEADDNDNEAMGEHVALVGLVGEKGLAPGESAETMIPVLPPDAEGCRVSIGCAALDTKAGPGVPIRCPPRARNRFASSLAACFSASARIASSSERPGKVPNRRGGIAPARVRPRPAQH